MLCDCTFSHRCDCKQMLPRLSGAPGGSAQWGVLVLLGEERGREKVVERRARLPTTC